eukprot:CAMPEP_0202918018 /NCGR_PEP_ID=MMETSP1392-20130828/72448_1 /ASSEMBLY_ACC=CAM_ASM_000868 /TAXON_ID=225041 /ORGANISM="Chlamydomonas chlamydogama, Strain SAG 11-48b" /LENGTH=50 /DNA_ID=CAMNT_0049610945 /DNA_START=30 /DNA_END=179 /DNA_ORIENTATION=-
MDSSSSAAPLCVSRSFIFVSAFRTRSFLRSFRSPTTAGDMVALRPPGGVL